MADFADIDARPATVTAADGKTTLHRFDVEAVLYAPSRASAQTTLEQAGIYLEAARLKPATARAALANDGAVRCSECGTDQFTYQESFPSERKMDHNADGVLVFWSCSREFEGDDDPGVVCENGHECDTSEIEVDWS